MIRGVCARAREWEIYDLSPLPALRIGVKPEWVWDKGNWDEVSRPLDRAYSLGYKVIVDVATDTSPTTHKPTTDDKRKRFAEFCGDLVFRYPTLDAIEVWNEPNLSTFSISMPIKVSDMTALLKVTTPAIRGVRSNIPIITGGLTPRGNKPYASYFKALFKQPGFKDLADGIAIHPYGGNATQSLAMLRITREIMNDHGLAAKTLWATELGWGSSGDGGLEGRAAERSKSEAVQASETRKLIQGIEANASKWKIGGYFAYTLKDEPAAGHNGSWADSAGALREDNSRKPVWNVLADRATERRAA